VSQGAPDPTTPWSSPAASSWALAPNDTLSTGRRVIRRLGAGGAHEAFLVEAGGPHGLAVAKLPRPHLTGDLARLRRLRDEGRALDRLAHASVPRHLDTVLSGPHPHLLLEHVPGPTLRQALAVHRALEPALVAGAGSALALALDHVVRAGWVHLDVKPSNIVLNRSPRLIDFELARPAAEAARMAAPTGTWCYMAPEHRAAGGATDAPPIGPPADVFALAVSLGEALTGRPPDRPYGWRPEPLPGRVGALIGEALAPAPGDRPTAAELADGLALLADARPALAFAV
jgi:eukaryotic-like serine/threonine-protein kinase